MNMPPSFFFDDRPLVRVGRRRMFEMGQNLYFYSQKHKAVFIVEHGFETDFASIPWFLQWRYSVNGKSRLCAILHDRGYEKDAGLYRAIPVDDAAQLFALQQAYNAGAHDLVSELGLEVKTIQLTRKETDLLFLESMPCQNIPRSKQLAMYHGVRVGGWASWGHA